MDTAYVGLIGALVGTVLGFLLNQWVDSRRWRREDLTRLHAERVELYPHFLVTVMGHYAGRVDWDDYIQVYFQTFIVGSFPVKRAIELVDEAIEKRHEIGAGEGSEVADEEVRRAVRQFVDAIAIEVDVPTGSASSFRRFLGE